MKKRVLFIMSILFIILIILFKIWEKNNLIEIKNNSNNKILEQYHNDLKLIEANMDFIAYANADETIRWYGYKKQNIDSHFLSIYNELISNIYVFNVYATDDGTHYTSSNYLSKFINKKQISKKEFQEIMHGYQLYNEITLSTFESYRSYVDDTKQYDVIKNMVEPILSYRNEIKNKEFTNYKEVLENELKRVELIKSLSNFLKEEYIK